MSSSADAEPGKSGLPQRASWRGKAPKETAAETRGWKGGKAPQPLAELKVRTRRRRLRIVALLIVVIGLFGLWTYALLFNAVQTPFVSLVATDYEWPLPPNAWAQEDVLNLAAFDRQTLNVAHVPSGWRSAEQGLQEFGRKLRNQCRRRPGLHSVIMYVSLHGVVDDRGEPCLVPPGASIRDSSNWLPLRDLLAVIQSEELPAAWHKVLILDCNRVSTDWRLGVLTNTFAERLSGVVKDAAIPNLIVLNSTSPGQTGWSSQELRGSVFGHFLRRALQGDADVDGNQRISVNELADYLRQRVNQWALANRADRQEPMLIAEDSTHDVDIVWTPRSEPPLVDATASQVKTDEVRELWFTHDRLRQLEPIRFAPLAWSDLEHQLLWLDQLVVSGGAYAQKAADVRDELKKRLTTLDGKLKNLGNNKQDPARLRNVWLGDRNPAADPLPVHNLPLAEFFGTIAPSVVEQIRDPWNRFAQAPRDATLAEVLPELDSLAKANQLPLLTESNFLHFLQRFELAQETADEAQRTAALSSVWVTLQRSEQTAVPQDERVSYWIRPWVEVADSHRRAAEDALCDMDSALVTEKVKLAEDAFIQADAHAGSVTKALQLRDAAYAELPYLAQWLCRPIPHGQSPEAADKEITETLPRSIANLHQLGEHLAHSEEAAAGSVEALPFAQAQRELESDLAHLQEAFRTHCTLLEKGRETGPDQVREIAAVLATPLIPAESRMKLLQKQWQLEAALNDAVPSATGTAPAASQPNEPAIDLQARIETRWQQHPAWLLLHPDWLEAAPSSRPSATGTGPTPSAAQADAATAATSAPVTAIPAPTEGVAPGKLEMIQQAVRQRLRELATRVEVESVATADALRDATTPPADPIHLRRNRADRLARAAASMWGAQGDRDPVNDLRRFDLQQLVLWHCRRSLDDFRGPAMPHDEPYFSLAAAAYLGPWKLFQDADREVLQERDALRDLLSTRKELAQKGLSLEVENVLLIDSQDACRAQVTIGPAAGSPVDALPQGRMAFLVRREGKRLTNIQLAASPAASDHDASHAVELRFPPAQPEVVQLSGPALAESGPDLQAAVVFRGHEFTTHFLVQTLGGTTVDYRPQPPQPTRVTLKGVRRQHKSIVFILDCSDSMQQMAPVEATDGQSLPRLEIAKNALQGMLDQLGAEGATRVGVRLFGHRVGWSTTEPVRILRQNSYARPIPPDLSPADDVELVLPLGRFDSVMAGQVAALLQSVRPWGQTPLYRSLVAAVRDFDADPPDTDKHIVVISDGMNYQFTPAASGQFAAANPTELDDVVTAWAKHQPTIHIVGFGIPDSEAAAAEQAYRELVSRTKGSYEISAVDAQALLGNLDRMLTKSTFRLLDTNNQDVGAPLEQDGSVSAETGPAHLGESMIVSPPPHQLQDYEIACEGATAPLMLRGGENAVLELSNDGQRINSVAFLEGSPQFGPLIDGGLGRNTPFFVGAHRPVRGERGVQFLVSLQSQQGQFVPRPAEIWLELTPLLPDGQRSSSYLFYDSEFDPRAPVPALRWVAYGWPAQAQRAAIRCWTKVETSPIEVSVPVAELGPGPAERRTFSELPGVAMQLETIQREGQFGIRVIEWHGADSAGVGSLRVHLTGPAGSALRPQRVVHTFSAEQRVAAHVFFLADLKAFAAEGWEIQLTKAGTIQQDAMLLAKPLEIDITDSLELLAPTDENRP